MDEDDNGFPRALTSPHLILFSHLLLLVNYYLLDLDACKWFSQMPAVLGELEFYVYLFLSSK